MTKKGVREAKTIGERDIYKTDTGRRTEEIGDTGEKQRRARRIRQGRGRERRLAVKMR